jgi:tetratricopeptide (TPR) repeat protein
MVLSEVEGYLDLVMALAGHFELDAPARDRIAQRILISLEKVPSGGEYDVERLYYRGEALRVMERYEEAVESLQQAAEIHPDQVHIWLAIGWCEKRLGQIDLATAALQQAAIIDPENALVHYNLACYFSLAGDADTALHELGKAARIEAHYLTLVLDEVDFDPIRDDPRLALLLSESLAP